MNTTVYTHRYIAQIDIETTTPLAVGSGEKDFLSDSLIAKDVNGLPYIPGTALAGIVRHAIGKEKAEATFGTNNENGKGSLIIFSSAHLIDSDGTVIDGLFTGTKSDYLSYFDELPIRQHAAITHKGVTKEHGKFDEEVVYKGTRFRFELEMIGTGSEEEKIEFENILNQFDAPSFRIGSGTRNGFGEIKIANCACRTYKLADTNDLALYLQKTASLNSCIEDDGTIKRTIPTEEKWETHTLRIQPVDFFLFSSGFGDDKGDADMTPVTERFFDWSEGKPTKKENNILIPATSVKGALSHRIAFHYNKLNGVYADKMEKKEIEQHIGNNNKAVKALFGFIDEKENKSQRGHVIISDIIEEKHNEQEKILNHVAIDRFTGGAIDGALFAEKVTYGGGATYTLTLQIHEKAFSDKDENIKKAFEATWQDLGEGMLPLGGGVNRGHGCFIKVEEVMQ